MDRVGSGSVVRNDIKHIAIIVNHVTVLNTDEAAYHFMGLTKYTVYQPFVALEGLQTIKLMMPLDPDNPLVILERQDDGTFAKQDGFVSVYPSKARFEVVKPRLWIDVV